MNCIRRGSICFGVHAIRIVKFRVDVWDKICKAESVSISCHAQLALCDERSEPKR